MSSFTLHTLESAPEASRPLLQASLKNLGMIPNLFAAMAESPQLLEAYQVLHALFQETGLDAEEQTVVWQAVNREHECHYCLPAHTAVAHRMGVDTRVIDATRDGLPLPSKKLEVLRNLTLSLVKERGRPDPSILDEFYRAGYTGRNLLEVLLGVTQKVMSNYFNHLARPR